MIYLRFSITRELPAIAAGSADTSAAEFMFQSEDARESTRRAVGVLREQGWKALEINDAWEGYSFDDFKSGDRPLALFRAAEEQGFAYRVAVEEENPDQLQIPLSLAS
jgi:hypothetical protein